METILGFNKEIRVNVTLQSILMNHLIWSWMDEESGLQVELSLVGGHPSNVISSVALNEEAKRSAIQN